VTLRRLAKLGLAVLLLSTVGVSLYGFYSWQDFNRKLDKLDELSNVQEQIHHMTSAIDYITLIRSESSVIKALSEDAQRLGQKVSEFDHPQTRIAAAHLAEIADMGEYLLASAPPPVLEANLVRQREMLLMVSRQIRVHHAGARESVAIAVSEARYSVLDTLYAGVRALIVATLILAALMLAAISLVHGRLLAPILALDVGLRRVSEGDLSARLSFDRDDELGSLARSFNHMAEQRQQFEDELATSETRFRQLVDHIGEVFWVADPHRQELLYVSPSFETLWGQPIEALMENPALWREGVHAEDQAGLERALAEQETGRYRVEYRIVRPDGSIRWVYDKCSPVHDDTGKVIRLVGVARDITERKEYQIRLGERIKELRCLYRVLELTAGGDLGFEQIAAEVARLLPGSLMHESLAVARVRINDHTATSPDWQAPAVSIHSDIKVDSEVVGEVEVGYREEESGDAASFLAEEHALINGVAIHLGRMIKNRQLNDTLTRSERMKAVGELTGGIAHDFNNLLTVILGNAEMLAEELAETNPNQAGLAQMIGKAAHRGADLTGRLLAFARRQALEPRAIDVNDLVAGMVKMLQRSLGENIELNLLTADEAWPALADPAQLESAILNLCLNARDAMPSGGQLTIETGNRVLDREYADQQDEVEPGDYVMLAISDTGIGIESEHLDRVFEPFFSTKAQGSGLGLSMVYGLVKQLRGHVRVYSEPGQGTTVRLYLPRAETVAPTAIEEPMDLADLSGTETILLVEDNELVRSFASQQLRQLGYRVLEAADGPHALVMLRSHDDIDLLFTDVIMPGGLTGPELANLAKELHPTLPVLFTSGYTENAIIHQGRLDEGTPLLSKPYCRVELGQRIRQALTR
jgi:PAS domain S-box-containing protein